MSSEKLEMVVAAQKNSMAPQGFIFLWKKIAKGTWRSFLLGLGFGNW